MHGERAYGAGPLTFRTMRAGLVRRGLITDQGKLTPAGDAYCDALLVDLTSREADPCPVGKPRVRWTRRKRS